MMDYSKLSDRELDAVVAEKVCGWKLDKDSTGRRFLVDHRGVWIALNAIPHYSTDANAALEAARKWLNGGVRFEVQLNLCGCDLDAIAYASETHRRDGERASHRSSARALCEAILAATEPH